LNERITISIDVVEEEGMEEPNVIRIGTVQSELAVKATEEGTPVVAEISANLNP
jgi:hypothetical protein